MNWRAVLMVVVLVAFVAHGSDASLISRFRKLAETKKNEEPVQVFFGSHLLPLLNTLFGMEF